MVNGVVPTTARELARCGLSGPGEVRHVIGRHFEDQASGLAVWWLRGLDDIPPRYLPS